jgi:hypothetical protein
VNHRLLVTRRVVAQQVAALVQGLPQPSHVAVPEDPEAPGEELGPRAVALDLLRGQEPDECLGDRQASQIGTSS